MFSHYREWCHHFLISGGTTDGTPMILRMKRALLPFPAQQMAMSIAVQGKRAKWTAVFEGNLTRRRCYRRQIKSKKQKLTKVFLHYFRYSLNLVKAILKVSLHYKLIIFIQLTNIYSPWWHLKTQIHLPANINARTQSILPWIDAFISAVNPWIFLLSRSRSG